MFLVMAVAVAALLALTASRPSPYDYMVFVALFWVLFVASGVGNGAVFQMIPAAFIAARRAALRASPDGAATATREGTLEGAAALGLASGIAAFGGFFIPKAYGTALAATGSIAGALLAFIVFYCSCIAVTWWFYARGQSSR